MVLIVDDGRGYGLQSHHAVRLASPADQHGSHGKRVKTQREAWLIYDQLLSSGTTRFAPEPRYVEEVLRKFANLDSASPHDWTDSYLAAFAEAAVLRLVTFDKALATRTKRAILLKP